MAAGADRFYFLLLAFAVFCVLAMLPFRVAFFSLVRTWFGEELTVFCVSGLSLWVPRSTAVCRQGPVTCIRALWVLFVMSCVHCPSASLIWL